MLKSTSLIKSLQPSSFVDFSKFLASGRPKIYTIILIKYMSAVLSRLTVCSPLQLGLHSFEDEVLAIWGHRLILDIGLHTEHCLINMVRYCIQSKAMGACGIQ